MQYICSYVDSEELKAIPEKVWDQLPEMELRDVVTGEKPRLSTTAKACWTAEDLYIRFWCEDDHIVSEYKHRDEPLYEQDVVEVFLDPTGKGELYYEFELSPYNVQFDAEITILDKERATGAKPTENEAPYMIVDTDWDAANWQTSVTAINDRLYCYELRMHFADFNVAVSAGEQWRWNLYRIDDDQAGERHYSAWSSTGAVNYHVPTKFGTLTFVKEA